MDRFFSGFALYGDDFTQQQIDIWYSEEAEANHNMAVESETRSGEYYKYGAHALNIRHGFRYIKDRQFQAALGFGSAKGDELIPIINQIESVTIVDSSDYHNLSGGGEVISDKLSPTYVKANATGDIHLPDNTFDLVTCFSVLHHIPNVSKVMSEIFRVMKPGGVIESMGDWRRPRRGLSKNERGLPDKVFKEIIDRIGFSVIQRNYCVCSLSKALGYIKSPWQSYIPLVLMDELLSWLFIWNINYHPNNWIQRLRPKAVVYVLEKQPNLDAQNVEI